MHTHGEIEGTRRGHDALHDETDGEDPTHALPTLRVVDDRERRGAQDDAGREARGHRREEDDQHSAIRCLFGDASGEGDGEPERPLRRGPRKEVPHPETAPLGGREQVTGQSANGKKNRECHGGDTDVEDAEARP